MEKKVQSEWWFLGNINFITVGISYFIYLIIALLGNIIDVAVLPIVAACVIGIIYVIANFAASKITFSEAKLETKSMVKYFIYNLILFLIISYQFVPFIAGYIGFEVGSKILVASIVGIVAFGINSLFVINLNEAKGE